MTRDARTRKRQCHTTLRSHVKHHSDTCPHPHLLLTMTLRTIFKVGEPCLPFAYTSLQRLAPSILRQQIPSFVVLGVCYAGCPLLMVRVRFQVRFCTLQLTIVVQSFGYLCMSSRRVARRSSGFSLRATLTCLFNSGSFVGAVEPKWYVRCVLVCEEGAQRLMWICRPHSLWVLATATVLSDSVAFDRVSDVLHSSRTVC